MKHRKRNERFSDVIKRLAPPPIKTFGDLKKHLQNTEGPLFTDMEALRRIKARKAGSNAD